MTEDQRAFVRLVKMMRAAQTAYFRAKTYSALTQARKMEKLVDEDIARIQNSWSENAPAAS